MALTQTKTQKVVLVIANHQEYRHKSQAIKTHKSSKHWAKLILPASSIRKSRVDTQIILEDDIR